MQPFSPRVEPKAYLARDRANAGLPSRAGGILIGVVVLLSAATLGTLAVAGTGPPNISRYLAETRAAMPASTAVPAPTVAQEAPRLVRPGDDDVPPPTEKSSPPPELELSSDVPPTSTVLELPSAADGHRVYVDGALIGEPPSPFLVGCGHHLVQIGSRGRAREVELPCGERVALAYP